MTTTVEIVTVPSADTPGTSLHIHNEKRSYIFGRVAEGTQRAYGSRRVSISSIEHIFLSGSVSWQQMGGLIGFLLTIGSVVGSTQEVIASENAIREAKGKRPLKCSAHGSLNVYGADNMCHALAACRPIIFRQPVFVRAHEFRHDSRQAAVGDAAPDFEDDALRVWNIPVKRVCSSSPPKRHHDEMSNEPRNDAEAADSTPKVRSVLSDPTVAGMVVERLMFNGNIAQKPTFLQRKIGDLRPGDPAVTIEHGIMKPYTGPYSSESMVIPNADEQAYLFPEVGEPLVKGQREGELSVHKPALPRTAYGETSMSYIIKCQARRGKFNPVVAKEWGVKPKDFRRLTEGQSVEGKDGKIVTPDMVLGEAQPGRGIIVADIATPDLVDSFMGRPEWKNEQLMEHICVVYWILGNGLASDLRIQRFIQEHPTMRHVFCAEETCPNMITHQGAAEVQSKLRRIDPERFPILDFDNKVAFPAPPADSPIELGRAGKKVQLMPRLNFDDKAVNAFPDLIGPGQSLDGKLLSLAEAARAEATRPDFLEQIDEMESGIPNRDAEIVPLGTGSSTPSKHRNVSGTLVRVPGIGNYLFDCGEGSMGQITRAFGPGETADIVRNLKCIVISHLHADHHMGVVTVIREWYEQSLRDGNNTATLAICCIRRYRAMLEELAQIEDFGLHRVRFPTCPPHGGKERDVVKDFKGEDFGLRGMRRVPVQHCWRSCGTELELTSGLRIAYSGDCRPSSFFASAFKGAHLLIHECTFGDDMVDHARQKKHSTMSEALGVAREMQARRTLLTHFSQRYAKSDSLRKEQVDGEVRSVLLAFDLMRVRLGDFQKAACYVPVVEELMGSLRSDPHAPPVAR
ncbi:hypothetical protein AAL_04165 [Moelleriella libera RCEF 2490]|uniref:ribonuclease Z n=1 Tax=Moelleriella libera RCEF 2490 TaxID=1081109 RepID=A0A168BXE3_9HYPO|nr:hypothetical protein AAL_04165 [Moelleriella libera RCEF 2490]